MSRWCSEIRNHTYESNAGCSSSNQMVTLKSSYILHGFSGEETMIIPALLQMRQNWRVNYFNESNTAQTAMDEATSAFLLEVGLGVKILIDNCR